MADRPLRGKRDIMRFWKLGILLVAALSFAHPSWAQSEKRVALIIGNDSYSGLKPLDNAVNDARAMDRMLKSLGWETILKTNASRHELNNAIDGFGGKLSSGAVGLFYYAGHGVESHGQNYLIPVDAVLESEADLRTDALGVDVVMTAMRAANNPMNIVILDACRDNPLKARSGSRGLAVVQAPSGSSSMFVAYAAAPGEKAEDGDKGGNGVFTGELVKALAEPGLKIEDVFKHAVAGVKARTGGRQVPWTQASLSGDFYFRPQAAVASVAAPAVAVAPAPNGGDKESLFWQSIKESKDPAD